MKRRKSEWSSKTSKGALNPCNQGNNISKSISQEKDKISRKQSLNEVLDTIPEPVFECDVSGKVIFANQAAFLKFGYTVKDLEQGLDIQ
ncbi:PAS domain-containing protein, partial [bacterium]|nr:PAS domain-containing protein [candidate division CSSED10-310 bacterium]